MEKTCCWCIFVLKKRRRSGWMRSLFMKYTEKQLIKAINKSTSFNECARLLGLSRANSKFRNKIRKCGVDISHFKFKKYSKELLEKIVSKSISMADVARHLGTSPNGGSKGWIKKRIDDFKIDTSHFVGQSWSKGKSFTNRRKKHQIF
jgi:hypothetical protein